MTSCVSSHRSFDAATWSLLVMVTALIAALELYRPLAIAAPSLIPFCAACIPLVAIAYFYNRVRPRPHLATMALSLVQMLVFSALGCVLQYLLAREGGAMLDARLASWDKALGLDWLAFVRAVDAHPPIVRPLGWAYAALIPEVIAVVLILGLTERLDELRIFILAGMLCGAMMILVSPLFPSISCYVFLGLTQADFRYVDVNFSYSTMAELAALRAGNLHVISLPDMQGVVTFPSYHAGLALVSVWGFWNCRSGWLRYPGLVAAIGTIVSAPVHGGHYFVDVFAGLAIAAASILAAKRLVSWPGIRLPLTASPFRRSHEAFAR